MVHVPGKVLCALRSSRSWQTIVKCHSSFLDETAKALSRKNMGNVYTIKHLNGGDLKLAWKKIVSDGIKFQVGNIELVPDKPGGCFLFNYSLDCIATLEH